MGRYMRKCKGVGEVVVMEVSQVAGVRTRARALAALRRNSSAAAVVGELQVSYLELRSRRLVKSATACGDVSDLEVDVSLGETAVDHERSGSSIREAAASSNLGEESEALESTTSPDNNYGDHSRKSSKRAAPSASEIEEFFAAFDKEEQRRFTERYNYDPVKDVPLAGRYEWVKVTP